MDARAAADLRGHLPRLLARARALLKLSGGPPDRLAPGELRRATEMVSELHQGLVGERKLAEAKTYDRPAFLGAYLLWWWPQSYARVRAALSLAPLPFLRRAGEPSAPLAVSSASPAPLRVLDLGAGPGPAAIAIADLLGAVGVRIEALLVDESEAALAEAQALAAHHPNLSMRVLRKDLAALVSRGGSPDVSRDAEMLGAAGSFELISAAHLLSELPGGAIERAQFLQRICSAHLLPRGALCIVEPALRETGRALLEVRDRLLASSRARESDPALSSAPRDDETLAPLRAFAPCLTQAACPALVNPRDWCTAELSWEAPPHLLQLSRELGLHAEAPLSFAPLLLSRAVPAPPPDVWRVVGVPPAEKGKQRRFVCAEPGRVAVARLDRDAGPSNAAFDEAGRGDLLRLRGLVEKGDGLRVLPSGTVEAIAPSDLHG